MSNGNPPCPDPVEFAAQLVAGLGPQIRRLRQTREMTQLELGNASLLMVDHIGKLERGEICPKLRTVARIAAGLGVPVAHLVDAEGVAHLAAAPDPLVELVAYLRQRSPEDAALALTLVRQVFDR